MAHAEGRSLAWTHEHTLITPATPEHVWRRWSDPLTWPRWDQGLREVTSVGPFERGSRGTVRPVRGPRTVFVLTAVEPGVSFTTLAPLPLATMTRKYRLRPLGGGTELTHVVTFTGPAAPLFGRLIGRRLAAGLPVAMRRLADLAEADQHGA